MSPLSCLHPASASATPCADGETPFSAIPAEIMDAHILTKLDGPTLASAACVSTQLNALCVDESLWMDICNTTWPSITHPSVRDAISTFPSGYRSFFANSFPSLQSDHHHPYAGEDLDLDHDRDHDHPPAATTHELISAVDLRYKNKVVFSKVHLTNTSTDQFLYWPIDIDVLGVIGDKQVIRFAVEDEGDELLPQVEAEKLTLSWIVIDPTRKRAANFSSIRPLLVESTNNNDYKRIRYSMLMIGNESSETVEFKITVTFGIEREGLQGKEAKKGELVVREVSLKVVNVDGMVLKGKDGLVNLQKAMAMGRDSKSRRKNRENEDEYEEYLKMKEERKAKKAKEMALSVEDTSCMFLLTVAVTGWWICFCFFNYILTKKKKIAEYVSIYRR